MYVYTPSRDAHSYASKGKYVLIYTLDSPENTMRWRRRAFYAGSAHRKKRQTQCSLGRFVVYLRCQCAA
jgi:hypothetical protein